MNSKHNPVSSALAALATMSMLANFAAAEAAMPKAAKPDADPAARPGRPEAMSLEEMLAGLLGMPPGGAPAPSPIAQVCAIPQDIAERCGMHDAGFDAHGHTGRTVTLLAAVLSNLRELRCVCDEAGRAQVAVAESHITAAVAAVQTSLRTASGSQAAAPGDASKPLV
ncbi:hypothetical protein A4F85_04785 [Delftia sp. GW456-R20]|uniref:hypothetical protein n=1 Tax=Delftia sp. GW456-R20 TaxID=1827145 RepID=UPI0007AE47DD|nr:hypothetical protein [Delftia sp. GW456-R20]KZK32033.1 hypothetical protein A4F85_04785 [Delftia sp. GW456-R20]